MRIYVLSKKFIMGGNEIIGLFSELESAKKYAERQVRSFTWTKSGDVDVYMSEYTGMRPSYSIQSFEVDSEC